MIGQIGRGLVLRATFTYLEIIFGGASISASIHIALDSDTDSYDDNNPPQPKSRGATVKSKKGMHTKRNLRGTCILTLCNYTR